MFYELDIKSLSQNDGSSIKERLHILAQQCIRNKEYFIGYQLLKILSTYNPKDDVCVHDMAFISERWNLHQEADLLYKKVIDLQPKNDIFRWNYAHFLSSQSKQYDLALVQYIEAAKIKPDEPKYALNIAKCYKKLYNDDKDNRQFIQDADKYYLKAIEIDGGKHASYCVWYAKFLCKDVGNFGKAKFYLMKAIEIEPDNVSWCSNHVLMLQLAR